MVISASRRTDIPCYYGEWFTGRLRAGFVLTRNPFNHAQLSRLPLSPETADCIVFWTKDAKDFLPNLETVDKLGYKYYFQFTLTPYGCELERNLRDKGEIENTFAELSKRIGRERVLWRYDPIVLSDAHTVAWHKREFSRLCATLSPHTRGVTISFVDAYAKVRSPLVREPTDGEMAELAGYICETARAYGLTAAACCEKSDFSAYGIGRASCIDKSVIEEICGSKLKIGGDKNQRAGCGCAECVDVGAYNSCPGGCVYCYANDSVDSAKRRHDSHDPESALLIGSVRGDEKVTLRKVSTNKTGESG